MRIWVLKIMPVVDPAALEAQAAALEAQAAEVEAQAAEVGGAAHIHLGSVSRSMRQQVRFTRAMSTST